ncbi:MAG: haloacid dehalogenase type II [Acidobacteriaceae bacterium]
MSLFGFGKKKSREVQPTGVRAILFDTFGTTVDWLSSMTAHGQRIGAEREIDADWEGLAKAWRARYQPAIALVREGKRLWTGFDTLHREQLDKIVGDFRPAKKLSSKDRDLLTHGWHYLEPWPDVVPALQRLRQNFIVGPLSNGTTRQMIDLARWGNLPWDVVFGADMFRTYKPDKKLYVGAAALLGLEPAEVLLVAAHNQDLEAAKSNGLRTCFVHRPTEDPKPTGTYDHVVEDFEHLARIFIAA